MNTTSGHTLNGVSHIRQSISDILLTPIGSRVMRREYGSLVLDLIDHPVNGINHLDQTGESDISVLSRLGDRYNAVVSVKHGRLLFLSFGKGISFSGKELPAVEIHIEDCSNFSYRKQSRDAYTGVIVYWNNVKGGKRQKITLGTSEQAKELKQTFASEDEALQAARSELERLERATESLNLTLIDGRAEVEAEAPLVLDGFKPEIQKIKWAIASVVHLVGDHGFTTQICAEPTIK